jgi:hypothetical protein
MVPMSCLAHQKVVRSGRHPRLYSAPAVPSLGQDDEGGVVGGVPRRFAQRNLPMYLRRFCFLLSCPAEDQFADRCLVGGPTGNQASG